MARLRQRDGDIGDEIDPENGPLPPDGGGAIGEQPDPDSIIRDLTGNDGPPITDPWTGRGSEGPRDRAPDVRPRPPMGREDDGARGSEGPRTRPTPRRPVEPTPAAGTPQGGVVPFNPMPSSPTTPPLGGGSPSPGLGGPTSPILGGGAQLRGLLGSQGGLSGGGLGLPFDPVADEKSDPIAFLMQLLNKGQ